MMRAPVENIRLKTNPVERILAAAVVIPSTSRPILAFLLMVALTLVAAIPANADPADVSNLGERIALSENPVEVDLRPLDALLTVPDPIFIWHGDSTDADLAYAVTLGNDPDLEKRSSFRKHNFDLFRTERPIVVGQSEMLLRFRVRAKSKNTMSIELRF
jgi:hypothetical protein